MIDQDGQRANSSGRKRTLKVINSVSKPSQGYEEGTQVTNIKNKSNDVSKVQNSVKLEADYIIYTPSAEEI